MKRLTATLFLANFTAALAVSVFQKIIHIINAFAGQFGNVPTGKLAAEIPLLFGGDILSALFLSLAATAITWPLLALVGSTAARLASGVGQAFVGFWGVISYYTMLTTGSTLDRTMIDMALMQADRSGGATGTMDSFWYYLTPWAMTFMAVSMAMAFALCLLSFRKGGPLWTRRVKVVAGILTFLVAFHLLILPGLKSRSLVGERLRTWGVDRSFVSGLVISYGRSLVAGLDSSDVVLEDPFRLNTVSLSRPEPLATPPLDGAVPRRTNLVVILLESAGSVYLGRDPEPMPFLSGMHEGGTGAALTAHYTTWPQTTKAIFSLLCSELPYPTYEPISIVNPRIPCTCMPRVLKEQGYRTALFSSQDLTFDMAINFLKDRGFDRMVDINDMPASEGAWKTSWGLDERTTAGQALAWIRAEPDRPFFLLLGTVSGHNPYELPPDVNRLDADASDRDRYLQSLSFVDRVMADFAGELEAHGILEDTLFVIVSDHGESFGQHPGDFGHGATVWDSAVRVPVTLMGPQLGTLATRQVRQPTSHLDLAPTILGLLAMDAPFTMKGRDLSASRESTMALIGGRPQLSQFGLRDGRYKFVWTMETDTRELFDVERDPGETESIGHAHPELLEGYVQVIERWMAHSAHLIENYADIIAGIPR